MYQIVKEYLSNTNSNLGHLIGATATSIGSLHSIPSFHRYRAVRAITDSLFVIMIDYIPIYFFALCSTYLNDWAKNLGNDRDDEEIVSALAVYQIIIPMFLRTVELFLNVRFELRANVRFLALLNSIPLLFQEEFPSINIGLTSDGHAAIATTTDWKHVQSYSLDLFISFIPNNSLFYPLTKMWPGYRIVDRALNQQDLNKLNDAKVNSLRFLVMATYCLSSKYLIDNKNSYHTLFFDKVLLIFLTTVIANLKIRDVNLKSEFSSVTTTHIMNALQPKVLFDILSEGLNRGIANIRQEDRRLLHEMFRSLKAEQITRYLPTMFHSPDDFLDDPAITKILEGLNANQRIYLKFKFSEMVTQATTSLQESLPRRNQQLAQNIHSFFAVDRIAAALDDKLNRIATSPRTM